MAVHTALVTDSTCNLPRNLVAERRIYVAPLYVIWDGESYRDEIDITSAAFYQKLATAETLPKTSQVSVQDFVDLFETAREAEGADEIVCTLVSSDISGTYSSAMQAKSKVDFPVRVIDSRQTSWALGFPVLSGADARDAGAGPDEIEAIIRSAMIRQRLFFTIQNLEFLHRGGRIGNARLLLGSALNIKPILEFENGVVSSAENVRTRKRAVSHLVTLAAQRARGNPIRRLAAIHADAEQEAVNLLKQAQAQLEAEETYLSYVTTVLGVHVGPGAVGLIVEWVS